jgi:molybdopterin/thiamine biosynthesis adenylyltransferase
MKQEHPRLTGKPLIFDAKEAHISKTITFDEKGSAVLTQIYKEKIIISPSHQFDLTQGTIFGLNERITSAANSPKIDDSGRTLRDLFNDEWKRYEEALESAVGNAIPYGIYAYYPSRGDLVRYCPPYWHQVVATASSSMLIADPKYAKRWVEIRKILADTTLAVAGASVGNNVTHAAVMDLRPRNIKLADKSRYKLENINRVRLTYSDIVLSDEARTDPTQSLLRNKAEVTASQLYGIDPYINVFTYENGIGDDEITQFFDGDDIEPKADMIIEEVDDPRVKIALRQEARKRGIPLLMVSDLGSSVQLDILRYDLDKTLPLTWGTDDIALTESMEEVYRHPGDRKQFFNFVDKLIGTDYRSDELARIIDNISEIPTSTIIPQLGSTAMVAGGILAEVIARIRLGYAYPDRVHFNKKTFEIKRYGVTR